MPSGHDPVVAECGDAVVRRSDVATLGPRGWLNDAVIAFAYERLGEDPAMLAGRVLVPPSCVMLLRYAPSVQPGLLPCRGDEDGIFLPVNNSNAPGQANSGGHWSLAVVGGSTGERVCRHYDSMGRANAAQAAEVASRFGARLEHPACPQQRNSWDCGVYVLAITECLLRGGSVDCITPEIVDEARRRWRDEVQVS